MSMARAIAIDLGASSGRIITVELANERFSMETVHRFENRPLNTGDGLRWDLSMIADEIDKGLAEIEFREGDSISVDTWGVDYVLVDNAGKIIYQPFCYRDSRTEGYCEKIKTYISHDELYRITGTQILEMNTIFQLMSEKTESGCVMFIPDYLLSRLSGMKKTEMSIASTSSLLDVNEKKWSEKLNSLAGISRFSFLPLVQSGTILGPYLKDRRVSIIAGCSHDTQAATIMLGDNLFISCGTWSLMGASTDNPVTNSESMVKGFTNECNYGGRISYMKNLTGLWILQCLKDEWKSSFTQMEAEAQQAESLSAFIDTDDPIFSKPDAMEKKIRDYLKMTVQKAPATRGGFVRIVNESLAMKYRHTRDSIEKLTGKHYSEIHIVGGGCKSELLCSCTASALNIPVIAGPAEATAYGNALIQFIARGVVSDMEEGRKLIAKLDEIRRTEPADPVLWDEAYKRYLDVTNQRRKTDDLSGNT